MTKATFDFNMQNQGECFMNESCYKLQLEIIKKIVNCKAIDDFDKLLLIKQYTSNLTTNNCVIEAIKQYNKR